MNKNRELHKLFGLCWHEITYQGMDYWTCSCEMSFDDFEEQLDHLKKHNPDYAADPRLVLREMMKRGDWIEFCNSIGHSYATIENGAAAYDYIYLFYILDTTGKLRDLAIEWLKNKTRREMEGYRG